MEGTFGTLKPLFAIVTQRTFTADPTKGSFFSSAVCNATSTMNPKPETVNQELPRKHPLHHGSSIAFAPRLITGNPPGAVFSATAPSLSLFVRDTPATCVFGL